MRVREGVVRTGTVLVVVMTLGPTNPPNLRAWPWSRDMARQPSIDPMEAVFEIPGGVRHLESRAGVSDRMDAHAALVDPDPSAAATIRDGAWLFGMYCTPCHGPDGAGDGPVTEKFIPPPPLFPLVETRSDGYLYGTVRFGGPIMPPYGDELRDAEIWSIIRYLRREGERKAETDAE